MNEQEKTSGGGAIPSAPTIREPERTPPLTPPPFVPVWLRRQRENKAKDLTGGIRG